MKRTLHVFSLAVILSLVLSAVGAPPVSVQAASAWKPVGTMGFSADGSSYLSLAFHAGTPYIAYMDLANSYKATVMKFNGFVWETVGSAGFSTDMASYISLALDNSGTPYVAYQDGMNGPATVMKFNGSVWETVGSAGFSAGRSEGTSLALDSAGTPYVAYQDGGNGYGATVMRFNGTSWETVGNASFSAGMVGELSFALDRSNSPYVAYRDLANAEKATVMKFNGSSWETIGTAGFSADRILDVSLALDSSDTPYVVYPDGADGWKATVMKFNGSSWETIGAADFSAGTAYSLSLALDSSDRPYVAYQDGANGSRATVMKFNGSAWVPVGRVGFSPDQAISPSLALGENGAPYLAFGDGSNGHRATVMKFVDNLPADTIMPGPVTNLAATSGVGSIDLSWTAPADDFPDPTSGPVDAYIVQYSTNNNLTACNDPDGTLVTGDVPVPAAPGVGQTMTVSGLAPNTMYYFGVCARDEENNISLLATVNAMTQAFVVVAGMYDDADISWVYSGGWDPYAGAGPYNNTLHSTSTIGSYAEVTFHGARFILSYTRGPDRGLIEVYVDGIIIATLNANSPTVQWQQTWSSPPFPTDDHNVRFVYAGGGTGIDVDAIQIHGEYIPIQAGVYDDASPAWIYTGNWANYAASGPYLNTLHYTSTIGDSAAFSFDGTRFSLTYTQNTDRGVMNVYIDDFTTPVATLDQNGDLAWQKSWTSDILSSGTHTVKLVHAGPSGARIDVDAIWIFDTPDTVAPADISTLLAAPGITSGRINLSWTAVGDDGAIGTARSYLVRSSTTAIVTEADWANATPITSGIPTPKAAGSPESMVVSGLVPGQMYYFAVRAQDEQANLGGMSRLVGTQAQTSPDCPSGLCVIVTDSLGNPITGATIKLYTDLDSEEVAAIGTIPGYTNLNVADGNYIMVVYSRDDRFLIMENVTAPQVITLDIEAMGTIPVTVSARKLDDTPLTQPSVEPTRIYACLSSHSCLDFGPPDSNGELTLSVTPGTYDFMVWSWAFLYYLSLPDVEVSAPTTVDLHAADLPTGQVTVSLTDVPQAYLAPYGELCPEFGPRFEVTTGDTIILSTGSYTMHLEIRMQQDSGDWWYWLEKELSITEGDSLPYNASGDFRISTTVNGEVFSPGAQVSMNNLVEDTFGNRVEEVFHVVSTEPEGTYQDVSSYPSITIKDPNQNIISQAEGSQIWSSYSFTLPASSSPGLYTVTLTLDTGPQMGVITATDTFTVLPEDCSSGVCVFVRDATGNPEPYAKVEVFASLDTYLVQDDVTDEFGFAHLDVPDGNYTLGVSSPEGHFLVVKSVSAPQVVTVDPTGTIPVVVSARKLDDTPLANASIPVHLSDYSELYPLGNTDSNGELTVWVTPGTYDFLLWGWDSLYYLHLADVNISTPTTVDLHAADMPTGQATVNLIGLSPDTEIGIESELSPASTPAFRLSSGDTIVLSATDYKIHIDLIQQDGEECWEYWVTRDFSIADGESLPLNFGGAFRISTHVNGAAFSPGEEVRIDNRVEDSFGNRISGIAESPTGPHFWDSDDSWAWVEYYPAITITDPNQNVVSQAQDWHLWTSHSFTLPESSIPGQYTVTLSVNTGPQTGIITATDTFTILPTDCPNGLCVFVTDAAGEPVRNAYIEVFAGFETGPLTNATTNDFGYAQIDVEAGSYTLVVSSWSDRFLVMQNVSAPQVVTVDPTDTVQVTISAKKLDDTPLADQMLAVLPSKYSGSILGRTDADGELTAWISPGSYHFLAFDNDSLYYLGQANVDISAPTTIDLHAADLPTGQVGINLTNFPSAILVPWSEISREITPGIQVTSGNTVIFSAMDYETGLLLEISQDSDHYWFYRVRKDFTIAEGGSYTYNAGGDFHISTTVNGATFAPGDTISIDNRVEDDFGNRVDYMAFNDMTQLSQTQYYPSITIKDPNQNIISQTQDRQTWFSHSFTLPESSIPGQYTVTLTLDTGPHMGVITATHTFTVLPTDCPSGICVFVTDSLGNPVPNAQVEIYRSLDERDRGGASTNEFGYAELDVADGNYILAVSSSDEHFLVMKNVTAPQLVRIDPTGTVQVTISAKKLDNTPLSEDRINVLPSDYSYLTLGSTDSNGELIGWITPGMYNFMVWSSDSLYDLGIADVEVSGPTTVNLYAADLPTGQITVDLSNLSQAALSPWSELSQRSAPAFQVTSGSTIILSAGVYDIDLSFGIDQDDGFWGYWLRKEDVSIVSGGSTVYQADSEFHASTTVNGNVFAPGDTVSLNDLIEDRFGNRVYQVNIYTYTVPEWTYQYPVVTVTDPNQTIIHQEMDWDTPDPYHFTLPETSTPGQYTVTLSLDTGPHMGVITATATFTVAALEPAIVAPGGFTNDRTPTLRGIGKAGSRVNVWYLDDLGDPVQICQDVLVDEADNWTCESSATLPEREIELVANATGNNSNTSSNVSHSFTVDSTAPTVNTFTVTTPTNTLDIPLLAFTASDGTAISGYMITRTSTPPAADAQDWTSAAPIIYTVESEGSYTLYPWVKDVAGNVSSVVETPVHVIVDMTAPTLTISSSAPDPTNASPIPVTVQFSEAVTGFTAADITTSNSLVTNFLALDDDTYTFDLIPSGQGAVTVGIAGEAATDASGNGSLGASPLSRVYDSVGPTITIARAAGQANPTDAATVAFTVTFSEPVSGLDVSAPFDDFRLTASGVADASIIGLVSSGGAWTVTVDTGSGSGTLRLDVPSTATIADLAGNSLQGLPFTGGETYTLERASGVGIYDDTDNHWSYSGTWSTYTGTGPYAGTDRFTNGTGNGAQFTFEGAKFILTYVKASNRGLIDVYVDGTKIAQINAKNSSTVWQATWASPVFATGIHTVRFVHAGGGTYIDIDAIQVLEAPPTVGLGTYDDVDPAWVFGSGWTAYTGTGPLQSTDHFTSVVGNEAQFTFDGTRFKFIYVKASNRGLIDVYVDGAKIAQINAKSTGTAWQQIWTSPPLTPGVHTARFVHAGGGTYIDVDAIQILPPADTTPPAAITDLVAATGTATGTVTLTWTAPGDDGGTGTATSYLVRYRTSAINDETAWTNANPVVAGIPTPRIAGQAETMTISGLVPGQTYYFAVRAQDEESNLGDLSNSPAAAAQSPLPVATGTYDDADINWIYTGSWTTYNGGGPANNTLHYTSIVGNAAQFTFNGGRFQFTYLKSSNRGLIDVFVDSTKIAQLNAKSTSTVWQVTWTSPALTQGLHTVRFVHAGGGTYIDVDKIQIMDAPTPVPAGTYDDSNPAWVFSNGWTTYTGSGPLGSTDHYTNVTGSDAEITFTGTGFTFTYVKASNRGLIDVYIDGVKVTQINAKSTGTIWQVTWTSAPLTPGVHTVRFVHAGGSYIDVDAITIVP